MSKKVICSRATVNKLAILAIIFSVCCFAQRSIAADTGKASSNAAEPNLVPAGIYFGESTTERYAAGELQRYLSRISRRQIALCDSFTAQRPVDPNALPTGFILGTPATFPAVSAKLKELLANIPQKSDGYCIVPSKDGKTIYIAAWASRGVLYGVYDYLQNRAGIGFFEDGEYVPDRQVDDVLPPFKTSFKNIVEAPKFEYRSQWIWTRYYGADRGHPLNWGYEEWVKHLRWLAQRRFNSVMLYPVGYTRLWGDVHLRAFPETAPYNKEVFNDVNDYWNAHWSARAGWGRSPEETTRLMQKVLKFGREQLGLKFEYNFYLGNFEETLERVYPEGRWINWNNIPHHAYFGAAGRSPVLAFTDPRSKEYNQRLWRTFIKTFGTDHLYWIAYREESVPDPNNPNDPDKGKSLADAVNAQYKWMKEIDPNAEFFHWDWHDLLVWCGADLIQEVSAAKDPNKLPWDKIEKASQAYIKSLPSDIAIASVIPPNGYQRIPLEITRHYEPHPWVIGSLLGFAGQDVGLGGIYVPISKQFELWNKWAEDDKQFGGRLRGVLHWNEIIQVDPMLDHFIGEFAWSGKSPKSFTDTSEPNGMLGWYFAHRFGEGDAATAMQCASSIYGIFPRGLPTMRLPYQCVDNGFGAGEAKMIEQLNQAMRELVSMRDRQRDNPVYAAQVVDWSRISLHIISRLYLQGARAAALRGPSPESQADFNNNAQAAKNALSTLTDILATDQRHCLSDSMYRMTSEPGANRLLRLVMLEHASGKLFDNYALNDTAEFLRLVSCPLLDAYLGNLQKTMSDPNANPIAKANDLTSLTNSLKDKFMDMSPQPFEVVRNKRHSADILNDWLIQQRPLKSSK